MVGGKKGRIETLGKACGYICKVYRAKPLQIECTNHQFVPGLERMERNWTWKIIDEYLGGRVKWDVDENAGGTKVKNSVDWKFLRDVWVNQADPFCESRRKSTQGLVYF